MALLLREMYVRSVEFRDSDRNQEAAGGMGGALCHPLMTLSDGQGL